VNEQLKSLGEERLQLEASALAKGARTGAAVALTDFAVMA
jgi:hypothetical protein